jgi:glycosyltransferase involved in cell wall biosynthesis
VKILLISLFLPHPKAPHAGGRYVFELLRHLSSGHEVDLATRHEGADVQLLDDLRPLCRTIYPYPYGTGARRGFLDKLVLVGNYLGFSRAADRLISGGDYDLVLVEWVEAAILIGRHGIPMLLDAHDVMTKPAERSFRQSKGLGKALSWLSYRMTLNVERMIARRFNTVLTRSECDRQYLQACIPGIRSAIVPHPAGLDLTDYPAARQEGTILFLASYKHRPVNVRAALWFYHQVFPLVRREIPDARFVIAGYGPPPQLTALAADPQVSVTGFVEDLDRCYKNAAVFVAPILTGGGIIVKVLDALATGTPTVSTTFGNEGILAVPGRDLLVADEPADFAAAVVKLLRDRDYAEQLGRNGHDFVEAQFGLCAVMARLDAAIAEATGSLP